MTFTEIVDAVKERLNLSSSEATARIGRNVNYRYKRLTSSVGMQPTRRATVSANTVIGSPALALPLEKLEVVYIIADGKRRVLMEVSYDEYRNGRTWVTQNGDPWVYAIESVDPTVVNIVLDPVPTTVFAIYADGLQSATTLAGTDLPQFPESFHDTLVDGAMADEYYKMDNQRLAKEFEQRFEQRAADLRYFLAKSAYLSIAQNQRPTPNTFRATRQFLNWWK